MRDTLKPIEETMSDLWIKHESLRGRANVLGKATHTECNATYGHRPKGEQEIKEEIAYYEGFCDAAITVLEMRSREE